MDEILTFEEIKARYAPDWVLIGDLVTDDSLEVLYGRVLFHSPDHDEVNRKAKQLKPGRYAVQCLAPWPENVELIV